MNSSECEFEIVLIVVHGSLRWTSLTKFNKSKCGKDMCSKASASLIQRRMK